MRNDKTEKLTAEIAELRGDIKGLRAEHRAASEAMGLGEEVADLKREISELEIEKSQRTEEHEREKREVKHMVGLERKRQEFDATAAKREARLEVREESLDSAKKLVEEKLDFMQKRMEEEISYLKDSVITAILKRLPVVTVEKSIDLSHSRNGNGRKEEADA